MNPIIYTIQAGDTLYNLALQYNTTAQNILNTNVQLNPYNLRVGQQIYIFPNYWVSINKVHLLEQMNLVWEQHIMWTRMLLISIAENLKDLNATETRLLRNPGDIANIFKMYYGDDISNQIKKLLTEHLTIGKNLIVALKNKEETTKLNADWYRNADKMAEIFSRINPFYPKEEVRRMLYEHLRLTTNEVNARLNGKYAEDINAYDLIQKEILMMSHFFVDGIVKQFSDLF